MVKRSLSAALAAVVLGGCSAIWGFDDLTPALTSADGGPLPGIDSGGPCVPLDSDCPTNYCGTIRNRCGTLSDCQSCTQGSACGANGMLNACGIGTCAPSCDNKPCGASDGCGSFCSHGICGAGQHCAEGTCIADTTCSIGAPCPANDCAACGLYCPAEGTCCSSGSCTANAQCCPGQICHHTNRYSVDGDCRSPSAGDRCANDVECNKPGTNVDRCQGNLCCHPAPGATCYPNAIEPECCAGLACRSKGVTSSYVCCIPLHGSCNVPADCCSDDGTTCLAGTCCIASGAPGCRSNADCCAGSPGCVAGSCQ